MSAAFKPRVYLEAGCPYSFKFLLFLAETGQTDRFEIVVCDPDAPDDHERIKRQLTQTTGRRTTFPTVEIAPGEDMSDSDALIAHFARERGIAEETLIALAFYLRSIYPQLLKLHEGH